MRIALIAAALCSLLSGCGQKGPLFMPDDRPAPSSLTTLPHANSHSIS